MEETKQERTCKLLAKFYIIVAYIVPIIPIVTKGAIVSIAFVAVPVCLGIFNGVYLKKNRNFITREVLLQCTIRVKYLLIPMYVVGGLLNTCLIFLTFSPVIIYLFVGPVLVALLSAYGYMIMLGGSAFSFSYIKKSKQDGTHSRIICIATSVLQLVFTFDVLSVAVLAIKEKKYCRSTIAVIVSLILGFAGIIAFITIMLIRLLA